MIVKKVLGIMKLTPPIIGLVETVLVEESSVVGNELKEGFSQVADSVILSTHLSLIFYWFFLTNMLVAS